MNAYKIGQEMTLTWCPCNLKYIGRHAIIVDDIAFRPSDRWTDKAWIADNPNFYEYRHMLWQTIRVKGDKNNIIFPVKWMLPENEKHLLTP